MFYLFICILSIPSFPVRLLMDPYLYHLFSISTMPLCLIISLLYLTCLPISFPSLVFRSLNKYTHNYFTSDLFTYLIYSYVSISVIMFYLIICFLSFSFFSRSSPPPPFPAVMISLLQLAELLKRSRRYLSSLIEGERSVRSARSRPRYDLGVSF